VSDIELTASTGDPAADRIVRGVVGVFGAAFPHRVGGCYLRGSYATGTRTTGSDLDLFVVFRGGFRDRAEARRAHRVSGSCARLSPLPLEIIVASEQQLERADNRAIALNLKLDTRLVHGRDIRPGIPEFDADSYLRAVVQVPIHNYRFPVQRRADPALTWPLRHLDPEGPFYGYDQWLLPGPDGTDQPSTKLLVGSVGWTATALVALGTGRYVPDKRASAELYREHIGDLWTNLVVGVHERCRGEWHYRIPSADEDRRVLRTWCDRALRFQNHYLDQYRRFQLSELRSGSPDRRAVAARRLAEIRFPGRSGG
jgi:CYTH domain-containing protein